MYFEIYQGTDKNMLNLQRNHRRIFKNKTYNIRIKWRVDLLHVKGDPIDRVEEWMVFNIEEIVLAGSKSKILVFLQHL